MQGGERYNSISDHLKREFGRKTVKLSIDAGFTCPNRDGNKGYGGCAFCSEGGSGELASRPFAAAAAYAAAVTLPTQQASGSGLFGCGAFGSADETVPQPFAAADTDADACGEAGAAAPVCPDIASAISASISEQIGRLSSKWHEPACLAYFQAFTNTYAPVKVLRERYYAALADPRISGIVIATRPDCLGDDVLDLLSEINESHYMWVELGLQSIHPDTLAAMNTCYDVSDYDRAVRELTARGIRVVSHVILGLPGETRDMMLGSVKHVCEAPIFGIKLHLMNIVRNSRLYREMPDYVPFGSVEEYVDLVISCLEIIPPEVTIHRLTGDVPRKLLVSPEWSYKKRTILNMINSELKRRDTCQGHALSLKCPESDL